jgi:hypothetical protein
MAQPCYPLAVRPSLSGEHDMNVLSSLKNGQHNFDRDDSFDRESVNELATVLDKG